MKNYFSLTTAQYVGVVAWTVAILVAIVFLHVHFKKDHPDPFAVSEADLSYVQLNVLADEQNNTINDKNEGERHTAALFYFDPNTLTKSGWRDLGFSEKQADVIIRYKTENGPFLFREDLKKIFIIDDEKYAELEPYIQLQNAPAAEPEKEEPVELNSASAEDLEALPGIGETFAKRIIEHRNSLGGYVSVTQLHEVYNMTEETYQLLVDRVSVDPGLVKVINLNTASKEMIDRHPYIDWAMTAEILKQRDREKMTSLDFLVGKNLLTEEKRAMLEPYIRF